MRTLISFIITFSFCVFSHAQQHEVLKNTYQLITEQQPYPEQDLQHFWSNGKQGFFTGVGNIKISYKTFLQPHNSNAVIVVNGRTESYIKYRQIAYELYQLGYSVYLYDHRGQGFSERMLADREKGYVKKFSHYVDDLKIFYDSQVVPQNHQKIFIISHSMGGTISLLYADKYPQDTQAIALSAPMLGLENEWLICPLSSAIVWLKSLFGMQVDYAPTQASYNKPAFVADNPNMMTHSKMRYEQSLAYNEMYQQIKLGGATSHWLSQACQAMQQVRAITTKLKTPIMLLQAGEDNVVSASAQNDFCTKLQNKTELSCGGQNGAATIIQGGYHELLIEEDRYRIPTINKILQFFQQHL